MAAADNKELFRRYLHARKHPEMLNAVLAPDFVAYDLPEGSRDCAALKLFRERANQSISDPALTQDYLVAEGDLVAAHITATWRRAAFDAVGHALRQRASQPVASAAPR